METTTIVQIVVMILLFGFASGMVMMVLIIKYAEVEDDCEISENIKNLSLPFSGFLDLKKSYEEILLAHEKSLKENIAILEKLNIKYKTIGTTGMSIDLDTIPEGINISKLFQQTNYVDDIYRKLNIKDSSMDIKDRELPPELIRAGVTEAIQRSIDARKISEESLKGCYSDSNLKEWLEDAKRLGLIKNTGRFN